ncbi:MAG: hypothetical protein KC518_13255 [Candidatus Cloacimonetes bacterium]|nr:hypothetical protein [Candidatus Cloacimonadota bacterium]
MSTPEPELVEILDGNMALQAVDRAQIDIQISTARAYPRDIDKCKKDAMALATMDEATAETMFYVLPRGGKTIEGPSTRLAEVIANSWEHIRLETRVESIDDRFLVAVATAMDLQKNVAVRTSVRRRITDKHGKRYNDDMIVVTANAASSIAARNALFKVIPFAFVKPIYDRARQVAIGEAKSFNKNRDTIIERLVKSGCQLDNILGYFGYNGVDSITMNDLLTLKGISTAIHEGTITVEEAFIAGDNKPAANGETLGKHRPTAPREPEVGQAEVVTEPAQAENGTGQKRGPGF